MTKTVSLLFGVHAHQPVGNFPAVIDDAHLRCYRPFLQVLHRFPEFRFAVHFSGWLLDYLFQKFPEDMALLREMVARDQVELFGAGDTEPVLAVIPEQDRYGQLTRFSDKLQTRLGQRPQGAWLTERVWEATVVPSLVDAGIRYVTVDDYHFLCTGKEARQLDGYYTTEEGGKPLDLFPISEGLRYRIPFAPAHEVVSYLERLAEQGADTAAVYFDDIEKFGIWPETHEWVYEKKWLEHFITGVLASSKIRPLTYREYHNEVKTRGIIYLPTTSYIEMNEWTLPAPAAARYADLVSRERNSGRYDEHKAFVRGGIWKNFLTRYPESNWMHKRMQNLSLRLAQLPGSKRTGDLLDDLYEAQANDAYWHGLFGGLYLPHLRRAVYNAIVRLEAKLDRLVPRKDTGPADIDSDGHNEYLMFNNELQAIVKLDGHARVCELDDYRLNQNFCDTLRRQAEHYFEKIHRNKPGSENHGEHAGSGIASAHDRIAFKHIIAFSDLSNDPLPHGLLIDSWINGNGPSSSINNYALVKASQDSMLFHAEGPSGAISKAINLTGNRVEAEYHAMQHTDGATMSIRCLIAMPSCDGYAGRYIDANNNILGGFGSPIELNRAVKLTLDDGVLGGHLILEASQPVIIRAKPYFTVSQSEAGFEKIMQAVELEVHWPVAENALKLRIEVNPGTGWKNVS
ncbi:MAG TPA: alpha-amylase/4-alpha-glucanotransferase domain-containing protein [Gallionella sp.]|nr:alpha-amylase/4-alpha-glucanotransferase domain-containing protein [Gallionella sp.]